MRAAIYTRTSTSDGRQTIENQLEPLREFAGRMKWTIAAEFTDGESGASDKRPGLERLLTRAARRAFDVVLVFDLSRLTRGGPAKAFELITRLKASGVDFWSYTQEHFRTSGPAGALLIAIAAYIAEQERAGMQERIKAGMNRARGAGRVIGRPKKAVDARRARALKNQGKSTREIARILKVSKSTIERTLITARKELPR
jgi:DNA invertase Pin-like site-specific DNA recombinase